MSKLAHSIFPVLFSFTAIAFAQQPQLPPPPEISTMPATQSTTPAPNSVSATVDSRGSLRLDVLVTDKAGKAVPGLEQKDFTLLDNGHPSKILSFHAIGATDHSVNSSVQVILLLDFVNLGYQQIANVRDEVDSFFHRNGGKMTRPMSIYLFTDKGLSSESQPSVQGDVLAAEMKAIDGQLRTYRPSQGLYGAMERFNLSIPALTAIMRSEAQKPGKKLLLWVGPGWPMLDSSIVDITSKNHHELFASIVELSTLLRQSQTTLYSISVGTPDQYTRMYEGFLKAPKKPEQATPPNLALKVFAVQSGGRVLGPDYDLASQIDSCIHDADSFYTITFNPPRADHANEFHDLKVVIDKPGLKASTNTGYYNQP